MTQSSVSMSLAQLDQLARERVDEQKSAERRVEIERLVARKERKRVARARAARAKHERLEAQREAARRDGIREGEKLRARIEAEHGLRQRGAEVARRLELAALKAPPARRPWPRAAFIGLIAFGLGLAAAALPARPATAYAGMASEPAAAAALATARAEIRAHELAVEALEDDLALVRSPAETAAPEVKAPPRAPVRAKPRALPAKKRPAAPPAPACNDSIGDPCCAFGQVLC